MLLARMEPVREERELRGKRFIISKCKKRTKEAGKEGNKARLRERGERGTEWLLAEVSRVVPASHEIFWG